MPQAREISLAWLSGTVLTGVTSFLLMAAALYVSFKGQDTFSTPYEALHIERPAASADALAGKTRRARPTTQTFSDRQVIEASIRETVDGVSRIRNQPFVRVNATLATAATALSEDIPRYDPVALLSRNEPLSAHAETDLVNTDIYGAEVEGEIAVKTAALPLTMMPRRTVNDVAAAQFVRMSVEGAYTSDSAYELDGVPVLGYAAGGERLRELGAVAEPMVSGVAENVTIVPKSRLGDIEALGRTERILTLREATPLEEALTKNGFSDAMVSAVTRAMRNVYSDTVLPDGARLRILFGPSRNSKSLIPYRMSIYLGETHAVTVALTDRGQYVLGLAPPAITFPDADVEEVNVNNLPTIYRSIWETGRKNDLDDATIDRIVAMFAYDTDLTRRVMPGDSIDVLQSAPDEAGEQELLYVAIKLGNTTREMFRFRTEDGVVDFYDEDGETGKRFLVRRPLEGGGTLRSRYGNRRHPIFGSYRLHSGVDFAAPTGTPIYAAGDGVVDRAQWFSGYGRYVEIRHANGYATAYGHMNAIAQGITPGTRVTQGQVIGYVGSTGVSTGPHLHYEIKINGHTVDPLSVKLPRANALPPRYHANFETMVNQIRDLMRRDASPITVASN